jgi:hypothetical protein
VTNRFIIMGAGSSRSAWPQFVVLTVLAATGVERKQTNFSAFFPAKMAVKRHGAVIIGMNHQVSLADTYFIQGTDCCRQQRLTHASSAGGFGHGQVL